MKRLTFIAACVLLQVVAQDASGELPADAQKRSVSLFDGARRLIDAGKCSTAIPMLEESLVLNPSIGAHLSLSQCLATDAPVLAWREVKKAERLALARGDARAEYARGKAAALEPRVAFLRIEVPDAATSVELRVDGELVDVPGDVIAVASGEHVVEVTAPRKKRWTRSVAAKVGEVARVSASLEDASPMGPAVAGDGAHDPRMPRDARGTSDPGADQRMLGVIAASAGVAALAFSSVAGVVALTKKSNLEERCTAGAGANAGFPQNCGGGSFSPARRAELTSDVATMSTWATVSTVGFIAGAALLAVGVTVYLTAPSHARAASLRISPHGATVEGRF